jgi:hypothetical protein
MPTLIRLNPAKLRANTKLATALNRLTPAHAKSIAAANAFARSTTLSPIVRAAARKRVDDIAAQARDRIATKRPPAKVRALSHQTGKLMKARDRVLKDIRLSARQPADVIKAFLDRVRTTPLPPKSRETTSLLVRSSQKDMKAFTADLVGALGVADGAALPKLGIVVRQVLAPSTDRDTLYAVHFPVRRRTVAMEIHNLAWALRKTKRFRSVRPDGGAKAMFSLPLSYAKRAERSFEWHLTLTRTLEAHALTPRSGGAALGEGIVIAHPDTGWADHPQYNIDRIDRARSLNVTSGDTGGGAARHSRHIDDIGIPTISHGTATASIIVGGQGRQTRLSQLPETDLMFELDSSGRRAYSGSDKVVDPKGTLVGVAPRAIVRPIKFIDDTDLDIDRTGINGAGVVRIADENLVDAIEYARTSGAHVISLSVGGLMHEGVREEIDRAVLDANVIVVAAAGQLYMLGAMNAIANAAAGIGLPTGDSVATPAAYSNVIAVAGCSSDGRPWDESLRGPNVDITAPADGMWVADFDSRRTDGAGNRQPVLECASGTSFAAAFMAGVAALWLAHWGRDALIRRYPSTPLAWVFRHQLQRTATAAHAAVWDKVNYGPGVVDVRALLEAPLPAPRDVQPPPATVDNMFTFSTAVMSTPAAEALGDAFGIIYDVARETGDAAKKFGDAAWSAGRTMAENALKAGMETLTELQAMADTVGANIDRGVREAIVAVTEVVEAAAETAEELADIAEDAAEDVAESVTDFAEEVADTVGEAAEDAAELLFGWLPK